MSTRAKFFLTGGEEVGFDCEDAVWKVAEPLFATQVWVQIQTLDPLTKLRFRSAAVNYMEIYDKP